MSILSESGRGPMITRIRETLVSRLEETLRRDERVTRRLRRDTALPDDWTERAPLLADEDVLTGLDEEAKGEAAALRLALSRLDEGTYGTCVSCEEPIPAGRLEALPTAVTCVGCAGLADEGARPTER